MLACAATSCHQSFSKICHFVSRPDRRFFNPSPANTGDPRADGGTGAAPAALMDHVGMTLDESLPALMRKLTHYGLRDEILVCVSGKLVTPALIAWALAEGAVAVNSARGPMFALGCIQALQCDKNTCLTGITTHDRRLVRGLNPEIKSVRVANYLTNTKKQVGYIAHATGAACARSLDRDRVFRIGSDL